MFTLLIFIAVIAVLVLSHEFGHFIVAKWKGMRVDEFGFGFPPRIYGKKFGETIYSINLLPFGGFVKIWGEDDTEGVSDPRNFASRTAWDRFAVIVAGVVMNFLLAFVLFSIGHGIGLPQVAEGVDAGTARNVKVQILEVVTGSPAAQAGILPGDTITRISSEEEHSAVVNIEDVQLFVNANLGKENSLHITRGTEKLVLVAVPRVDPPAGEGALGIAMVKTGIVSVPWYLAPWEGLKTTIAVTKGVAEGLTFFFGNLFRGEVMGDVAGPVGIAQVAGQAGRLGIIYLIQLTALLSINLAILNLLPIPALDGGRIFFIVVEKIRGVPISTRMTQFAHTVGFFLLIALMLFVTYRDIVRIL